MAFLSNASEILRVVVDDLEEMAVFFVKMDEESRKNSVRFMLLSVTASPEDQNELTSYDPRRALSRRFLLREEGVAASKEKLSMQ